MNLIKVEQMAKNLLIKHSLDNWKFEFDNSKCRFGLTNYRKKCISLSKDLCKLNNENDVKDTILHEIAHAMLFEESNIRGHNDKWIEKAKEVGCNGLRCFGEDVITPIQKYVYGCDNFGKETKRYRAIRKPLACGKCCRDYNGGKYSNKYEIKLKEIKNIKPKGE